ncbi:septation ring formation regulator EzrA [Paenibacillus abyssi]|uniref:TPM domain-containing protein n=1 Tax=Paenibacillus abyssi TaxID=1340531 RepID=A0A917CGG4_9BACL|nr:septation ring formation regulator EzrA [Paenibacillus abyssi]GGF86794.1 hypothetical protein GCM10010916_00150 [Paenibacillus abyssi]
MRRTIVLLWLISLLLSVPSFAAAAVPDKDGRIHDLAAMLPADRLGLLEQAAQSGEYTFYVLTIDTFNANAPADYATEVYRTWELQANDVLVVIADVDRLIEMNFNNPGLQAKLNALPADYDGNGNTDESKITEFVNQHFIPSAIEGDFVQAILSLIEATQNLKEIRTDSSSTPAVPQPGVSSEISRPVPGTQTTAPQATSSSQVTFSFFWIGLAIVLLAIMILLVLAGWSNKKRIRRQQSRLEELMVQVYQASEQLKPYIGLVQGVSEQLVSKLERQLEDQMVRLNKKKNELSGTRISLFQFSRMNALYTQIKSMLDAIEQEITNERAEIAQLIDADRTIKEKVDRLEARLQNLRSQLDGQVQKTSYPLTTLFDSLDELDAEMKKAEQLEMFDPIAATQEVMESKVETSKLEEEVLSIPVYLERYHGFPSASSERRTEIDRLTETHRIQLVMLRLNPYSLIHDARETNERMLESLKQGNINDVSRLAEQTERLLADALAITTRQAELKQLNRNNIKYIESKQASYLVEIQELNALLRHVSAKYTANHWAALQERFEQMQITVRDAGANLLEIKSLCDDQRQEYDLANTELQHWLQKLREADNIAAECRSYWQALDERLSQADRDTERLWQQFQQGMSLIQSESLPYLQIWEHSSVGIVQLHRQLRDRLAAGLINLDDIDKGRTHYEQEITSLLQQIHRKLEEKREAQRQLHEAGARFTSMSNKVGSRVNQRSYGSRYQSLHGEAERLITQGLFVEAMNQLAGVIHITNEMNRDYNAALAAEQMQRQMNDRNNTPFGGGGSGGSSGGSSFGGGGSRNSSGGGSWGSKSNSSGGSKW